MVALPSEYPIFHGRLFRGRPVQILNCKTLPDELRGTLDLFLRKDVGTGETFLN